MLQPSDLDVYYFKKDRRPGQLEAIRRAAESLQAGTTVVIRAPTGFGKTSMALLACLPLVESGTRVFFAGRTHAQNDRVLEEAEDFNRHAADQHLPLQLCVVPLIGRTRACLLQQPAKGQDWESFAQTCKYHREKHDCPYYTNLLGQSLTLKAILQQHPVIQRKFAQEYCEQNQLCLYFFLFALASGANVLVGNYNYVLNPLLMRMFGKEEEHALADLSIVFDEAHNLPDLCRKLMSRQLAQKTVEKALEDVKNRRDYLRQRVLDIDGNTELRGKFPRTREYLLQLIATWEGACTALVTSLGQFQQDLEVELASGVAALDFYNRGRYAAGREIEVKLNPGVLDALVPGAVRARFADPQIPLHMHILGALGEYCEAVYVPFQDMLVDARLADPLLARELPFSENEWALFVQHFKLGGDRTERFLSPVAAAIRFYAHHAHYLSRYPGQFILVAHAQTHSPPTYTLDIGCFDARLVFARPLADARALLCMSGSVDSRDLTMLGIPGAARGIKILADFPQLVPDDHWLVLVDEKTLYDREAKSRSTWEAIGKKIATIAEETPGGVGVFCRSYDHVDRLARVLSTRVAGKKLFVEEQSGKKRNTFIRAYKDEALRTGAILLTCTYGRYGEGEDFPGAEMNAAIVVGLPLPPPSPSQVGLASFLDALFPGEGNDVAYGETAAKRVGQVAGRCVRGDTDRGLIILLDARMGQEDFKARLPGPLQAMRSVGDFAAEGPAIRRFFAPYLDFLLDLGLAAIGEVDPVERETKIRKFRRACHFYFSESHPPWAKDPRLAPKRAEIRQLQTQLGPLIP